MKIYWKCFVTVPFIAMLISWQQVVKYPLDDKPHIAIDTAMLGIWKVAEEKDKANFIVVQNYYDVHYRPGNKEHQLDKWDMNYTEYQEKKDYYFYVTYFNRHGQNPVYGQWGAYFSRLKGNLFLNFNDVNSGTLIVRIVAASRDTVIANIVANSLFAGIKNPDDLRRQLALKINDPHAYSDTLHFYKISGYHSSLDGAAHLANQN